MTNELKEKILAWKENMTRYDGCVWFTDDYFNELLAIIDDEIEKRYGVDISDSEVAQGLLKFLEDDDKPIEKLSDSQFYNSYLLGKINEIIDRVNKLN